MLGQQLGGQVDLGLPLAHYVTMSLSLPCPGPSFLPL